MSVENTNQQNTAASAGSYLLFPGAILSSNAIGSIKRNKSLTKAVKSCNAEGFGKLNAALKKQADTDIFSRSIALSENYDEYKKLSKQAYKTSKKAKKVLKKGKVSPFAGFKNNIKSTINNGDNKVFNFIKKKFNTELTTTESVQKKAFEAQEKLQRAKNALNSGKEIIENTASNTAEAAAKKTGSTFLSKTLNKATKHIPNSTKNTAKRLMKSEVGLLPVAFTILEGFSQMKEIIPAFKNEGFIAGIKQTGKSLVKVGTNFVSYAAGSVLGKMLGATAGGVIGGIFTGGLGAGKGAQIGAMVGDMVCSMFVGNKVTNAVNNALDKNENKTNETANFEKNSVQNQNIPISNTVAAEDNAAVLQEADINSEDIFLKEQQKQEALKAVAQIEREKERKLQRKLDRIM